MKNYADKDWIKDAMETVDQITINERWNERQENIRQLNEEGIAAYKRNACLNKCATSVHSFRTAGGL